MRMENVFKVWKLESKITQNEIDCLKKNLKLLTQIHKIQTKGKEQE